MASNSNPDSGTSTENPLSLSIFSKFIRNQHQQTTPTQINPFSIFGGQEPTMSLIQTTDTNTNRMSQYQEPTGPQGDGDSDSNGMEGFEQTGAQPGLSNIGMVGINPVGGMA